MELSTKSCEFWVVCGDLVVLRRSVGEADVDPVYRWCRWPKQETQHRCRQQHEQEIMSCHAA